MGTTCSSACLCRPDNAPKPVLCAATHLLTHHAHAEEGSRPADWAHSTLRELTTSLKLAQPSLVPEAVRLLQCAAAAVPHLQQFCADVCKVRAS